MSSSEYPDYVPRNVEIWTKSNEAYTGPSARRVWAREEIRWGIFGVPESEVGVLGDVTGLDVVELGCGTAYFSARLARRGARPVGVDPTPAQLATAREMQLRTSGFEIERLIELYAPEGAETHGYYDFVTAEWASKWPAEELWAARKRA